MRRFLWILFLICSWLVISRLIGDHMAKSHVNMHLVIPKNSSIEYDIPVYFQIAVTLDAGNKEHHKIRIIEWADFDEYRIKQNCSFIIPVNESDTLRRELNSGSSKALQTASKHHIITGFRIKSLPGGKQHIVLTSEDGIDRSEYIAESGTIKPLSYTVYLGLRDSYYAIGAFIGIWVNAVLWLMGWSIYVFFRKRGQRGC